ncbi:hypothetical protein M8J77_013834 [Diaphorina citri]|nr:hypothetical protein M8J77_013834 [Diaphorina citri]
MNILNQIRPDVRQETQQQQEQTSESQLQDQQPSPLDQQPPPTDEQSPPLGQQPPPSSQQSPSGQQLVLDAPNLSKKQRKRRNQANRQRQQQGNQQQNQQRQQQGNQQQNRQQQQQGNQQQRQQQGNQQQQASSTSERTNVGIVTILGDSQARNLDQILREKIATHSDNVNIAIGCTFWPGKTIVEIANLVNPDLIPVGSHVVLFGGTNDVFRTPRENIKLAYDTIHSKLPNHQVTVILVPPRTNQKRFNYHIKKLNCLIKYHISQFNNFNFIDTFKFLKQDHFAKDGLHLDRKGKSVLCDKILYKLFGIQLIEIGKQGAPKSKVQLRTNSKPIDLDMSHYVTTDNSLDDQAYYSFTRADTRGDHGCSDDESFLSEWDLLSSAQDSSVGVPMLAPGLRSATGRGPPLLVGVPAPALGVDSGPASGPPLSVGVPAPVLGVDSVPAQITMSSSPLSLQRSSIGVNTQTSMSPNQILTRDLSLYPKCFKCVHFNAQSIQPHLHEIRTIIEDVDLHVILISESWLKPSLSDNIVRIPGYVLLRHDREGKRGGGVAAYVRDDLSHEVVARSVPSPSNPGPEYMAVQVTLRSVKLLVVVVYKPPDVHNLNGIDEFLSESMPFYEHIIIMGDFNINVLNETSSQTLMLKTLISDLNIKMLQTRPTHHSHNSQSSSLIDLMLVLQEHKVTRYGQLPAPGISRHDMLYLAYSVKVPKYPVQFVTYRDIKGIDSDLLLESFGSLDWEPLLSESDINRKTELLRIKILEVFDEFAPLTESRVTRPPIPWMNASIKRCMRLRDKLWIKYRRTKSIEDRIAYNIQKNATNYAVRRAQKYFSRSILKAGSKSTWNRLRSLGLGKIKSSAPLHVGLDELNQYFVSVVPVPCPTVKNTILEEIENGSNAAPVSSDATFNFVEVSESDVSKAVLSIKSKASGYDGVDGKMVKLVLAQLLPILTHIFNESLSTGVFPFEWKSANVVPLQKVSSPSSCNDYRPISLLPILSKALEKLAIWQIMEFVESQSKLDLFQSGFRRRHSTATALVKVTDDVRLSLDAGKATILVLLDMSKAFDSVDFDVLIATLKGMGLSDNTLSWIGSYLRGRRQRVMHDGKYSEWKPINSGVPQGSVAGPLLFTIYITSLQRVFRHCKYHVYADDIQIYTHCWPRDIIDCIRQLNFELECFLKWAKGLFLHPNPTKTKVLAFGPKSVVNSLGTADLPPIVLDGVVLPLVSEARNLGVYIDNTLSWKCHVSEVRKRVFYSLHSLSKYRKTFPKELKKRLIEALVFPLFDYCDVVYPNLTDGLQQSLQLAQNACVRYVCNLRKFDRVSEHYLGLDWMRLDTRRDLHMLLLLYNILHSQGPQYFQDTLLYLQNITQYSTRAHNLNLLEIPRHRTQVYGNSYHVSAVRLWNSLHRDIRDSQSLGAFKTSLVKYLKGSQ